MLFLFQIFIKNNDDQKKFNFFNFVESKPIYYYENGNTRVTRELKGIGNDIALHRFKKTLKFVQKQQQANLDFSRKISEIRNQSKSQFNAICIIEEKKDVTNSEIKKELKDLKVTNSEIQKELKELNEMISKMFKSKQ